MKILCQKLFLFIFLPVFIQTSGNISQPDLTNGTSSLRDPSVKDAPKPGPSAGASSFPPIPQDYPSSAPHAGNHHSHTSVPPLVPPYTAMSSPSVPGQAQTRMPASHLVKPAEAGSGDSSKLTCHQCSKSFSTKPLLFSHQVRVTVSYRLCYLTKPTEFNTHN